MNQPIDPKNLAALGGELLGRISRREALSRFGTGFGMLGLASLLADEAAADASGDPWRPGPHISRPRRSG